MAGLGLWSCAGSVGKASSFRLNPQALPEPSDGGIFCSVLLVRHVAGAPISRAGVTADGLRRPVVLGDESQVQAGRVITMWGWVESAAGRAGAFDDVHGLNSLIVFQLLW